MTLITVAHDVALTLLGTGSTFLATSFHTYTTSPGSDQSPAYTNGQVHFLLLITPIDLFPPSIRSYG